MKESLTQTVNEFCHAYGITTKELIAELKAQFPGQKFTANSLLPEGFVRTVQEQAQEYAQVCDISLPETTGSITQTGEDTIADSKVKEALQYGILIAISNTRIEDFTLEGSIAAVEDIQAYQASYNQVWSLFQQDELASQQTRNLKLSDRLDAIAQQKEDADKQLGKNSTVEACVNHGKQQLRNRLIELLG